MISSNVKNDKWETFFRLSHPVMIMGVMALFVGGVAIAVLLGGTLGKPGLYAVGAAISAIIITLMLVLHQDELATVIVIAVNIYVDWYLGLYIVWLVIALSFLCIFFIARSSERPWAKLHGLWLWILFLTLTIFPAIHGALTLRDALFYYPNIIFGALICFWLGAVLARNTASIRRFFQILAILGDLIAVHLIIQVSTGVTLFGLSNAAGYLQDLSSGDVNRLGSFFVQPNYAGTFLAMMFFIPLGLFVESTSSLGKILYLVEMLLLLPALLFTYSAGAWLSALVGILVFLVFVGNQSSRVQIILCIIAGAIVILVAFHTQFSSLLQHASDPEELIQRNGLWQTAIRVIQAFPLTGIGLGQQAYLLRAEPYRVIAQYRPYDQPHNSYLEWAAMAGLPVLLVFLALITSALWQGLRNWVRADRRTRPLLGAGIAVTLVLCVNSWGNEGWTLPTLATLGWMILGMISSPLLTKTQAKEVTQKKHNGPIEKFSKKIIAGGNSD